MKTQPKDIEGRDQEFGPNWKDLFPSKNSTTRPPAPIDDHASALVRICELTAQRDELLAAAKAFTHDCDCYDGMNIEQFNSWKAIQTAIAKCEANK